MTDTEEDFGDDINYDENVESLLQAAESQIFSDTQHGTVNETYVDPNIVKAEEAKVEKQHAEVMDIEDIAELVNTSPFAQFRKKGWLSVSDLVGTVWCEVQYVLFLTDRAIELKFFSRMRTLPFLPPSKRPDVIKSEKGKAIIVDKVKVEGKEKILKRGEKIHKRLEREIHPEEIVIKATTREDVWGLRFLNMFSALEALITLGKCREMPVAGFVGGVLVMGIIDEITRKPLDPSSSIPQTRSSRQTALTSFFTSSASSLTQNEPTIRTHKVFVSDSKTRASGTLPRESDTLSGRLQCMVYKDLLDAMLSSAYSQKIPEEGEAGPGPSSSLRPSATSFTFEMIFAALDLDSNAPLSESFIMQSKPVIMGNDLKFGAGEAKTLGDMVHVWNSYVMALGLGSPDANGGISKKKTTKSPSKAKVKDKVDTQNRGKTEDRLELVYRRAGPKKDPVKKQRRKRRKNQEGEADKAAEGPSNSMIIDVEPDVLLAETTVEEILDEEDEDKDIAEVEEQLIRSAIEQSLTEIQPKSPPNSDKPKDNAAPEINRTSDEEREEDEFALAVELSIKEAELDNDTGTIAIPLSQKSQSASGPGEENLESENTKSDADRESSPTPPPDEATTSGSIIGRHRFQFDPIILENHLSSVLQYWMGQREPLGVNLEDTKRCGWCEFENDCEWRIMKAQEAWEKTKSR